MVLAKVKKVVKDRQAKTRAEKLAIIEKDFRLYALNYFKIVDNNGDLVPFQLNKQQEEFIKGMDKYNIVTKSRQAGYSLCSLAFCLWMALTRPNTHYLIVAHESSASNLLFEKIKNIYYSMPHDKYKFAGIKRDNRSELYLDNMSRVICLPAGDKKNIGRGGNFQYILLSEFAFYQHQESILLSAEQALAKNEDSCLVIESTGNGRNYFAELAQKAEKGLSKYKFTFTPWFADCYKKQFKFEHDLAWNWWKKRDKGRPFSSYDLNSDYEKMLYEKHGVTLKFLCWRRYKLQDLELQDFMQEYPSFPHECFQVRAGRNIFSPTKVQDALGYAIPELPFEEYKDILPSELHKYRKALHIYHLPKAGVRYWSGCDVASGVGGDFSAVFVLDENGRNCATFYSNRIPVYEFAEALNSLGRFYNYSQLVIERNGYGQSVLEHLRKRYEYLNLYKHRAFNSKGRRTNQLGFLTTNVSKSIAVSDFKEHFEKGLIEINDKETLQQMQVFIERPDGGIGNRQSAGLVDDLVDSAILAVQGLKQNKYYVEI